MINRRTLLIGGTALIGGGFRHGVGILPDLTTIITQAGAGSISVPVNYHQLVATVYTGTLRYQVSYPVKAPLPVYYNVGSSGWINPYANVNPGASGEYPGSQWLMVADATPAKIAITFKQDAPYLPDGFFDTSIFPIGGGQVAWCQQTRDGNLIVANCRAVNQFNVGIIKFNPRTRRVLATYNDPGWSREPGAGPLWAGPEIVTEYADGNLLIASVDGFGGNLNAIVFEFNPVTGNTSKLWNGSATSNPSVGTNLVKPFVYQNEEYFAVYGCGPTRRNGVEVVRRRDLQTMFYVNTGSSDELNSGDFRVINGVPTFITTTFASDVFAYRINGVTQQIEKTYNFGDAMSSPSSGCDFKFIDDNTAWIAGGFNGAVSKMQFEPSISQLWKSGVFTYKIAGFAADPSCCVQPLPDGISMMVATRCINTYPGYFFQSVIGP